MRFLAVLLILAATVFNTGPAHAGGITWPSLSVSSYCYDDSITVFTLKNVGTDFTQASIYDLYVDGRFHSRELFYLLAGGTFQRAYDAPGRLLRIEFTRPDTGAWASMENICDKPVAQETQSLYLPITGRN